MTARMMKKARAAAYLDLSVRAFEREVARGTLPGPVKLGGADHCDSLDVQSIALDCEEAFGMEIPDSALTGWHTVADVARTVAALTKEPVA